MSTKIIIICPRCGKKSLWLNERRDIYECLNGQCRYVCKRSDLQSDSSQQSNRYSNTSDSTNEKRIVIQCKQCGRNSLWFNVLSNKYYCQNKKCGWEGTPQEYKNTEYRRPSRPSNFIDFRVPVWFVRLLESKKFWIFLTIGAILLWILVGFFYLDSIVGRTIAILLPILVLLAVRYIFRRFIKQYSLIASSLGYRKGGRISWRWTIQYSPWLRLIIILIVIAELISIPWTGYELFTHQINPVLGSILFIVQIALFIWLIKLLYNHRYIARRPRFILVFFSVLFIYIVGAFAGIQPLSNTKDAAFSFLSTKGTELSNYFSDNFKSTPEIKLTPGTVESAIAKVKPAVVYVEADVNGGSGVIFDKSGYILTCAHVINGSDSVKVITEKGISYYCSVIDIDSNMDLAILKINEQNSPVVILGRSDSLENGQEVVAVGYALGLYDNVTTTRGIVSSVRTIYGLQYIQTDAAVNPGNSGGPLIDLNGEVVGIITFKLTEDSVEGMGFALGIDDIKKYIEENLSRTGQFSTKGGESNSQLTLIEIEKETFRLINVERQTRGIPLIIWTDALNSAARKHSEDMQERGSLFHDVYGQYAECCYGAVGINSTAKETVDAWMNSTAGHREILLDKYYYAGAVGIARDRGFFSTYRCY